MPFEEVGVRPVGSVIGQVDDLPGTDGYAADPLRR
jgi:hypothetical protein